ncbi:MAG: ATP-binding protein [Opitutaceae bacterium]
MNDWWRRRPLRFRLALWYAVVGTLLLAALAAALYFYVAERMARPLDHQLRSDLSQVEQRLAVESDRRLVWNGRPLEQRAAWSTQYPWFELWNDKSELVCRFWPFTENRVQQVPSAPARGRETISVFDVAPDLRLRVLSVPYQVPGQEGKWMLRLMRVHEPVGDALGALRWIILVALPVVIALLVVGGYYITKLWLMPLDVMAAEASRITADDLGRRLPVENPGDDLGRVATIFNVTLDRLQSSFEALDRFVADASHELRTPLTTLRSVGEVGLRRARSAEEYAEIIGSMLEEAQRLQHLIDRLLELASAEAGAPDVHRTEFRVDDAVGACVNELGVLAEAKGQKIAVDLAACRITTDAVLFRQALQNLIDNAVKYSPEGSTVRVIVRELPGGEIEVSVADEGTGISPENQVHLTERFFRPDRGRGRSQGGFGLGLSLTKAYMRVLGGALRYERLQPTGSLFRLVLPKGTKPHQITMNQRAMTNVGNNAAVASFSGATPSGK